MRILTLSHFNIYKGPLIVLKEPENFESVDLGLIPKHLNLENKGFFIYEYDTFKTANLIFKIPGGMDRTNFEELLLSIIIINEEISPKVFQTVLRSFEDDLKSIKNSYRGLYDSFEEKAEKLSQLRNLFVNYFQKVKIIQAVPLDAKISNIFPWGSHMCFFYHKKEDLKEILIPYFKSGLENNEFCVWITSEDLTETEAKNYLATHTKNFNGFLRKGQIEIIPYKKWYFKERKFNFQKILDGWVEKHDYALENGFNGVRISGNTVWVEKKAWKSFAEYEEEINNVVGNYRMIVLCTYSLNKCGANEVLDVIRSHQFATIRREGKWEIVQNYKTLI